MDRALEDLTPVVLGPVADVAGEQEKGLTQGESNGCPEDYNCLGDCGPWFIRE